MDRNDRVNVKCVCLAKHARQGRAWHCERSARGGPISMAVCGTNPTTLATGRKPAQGIIERWSVLHSFMSHKKNTNTKCVMWREVQWSQQLSLVSFCFLFVLVQRTSRVSSHFADADRVVILRKSCCVAKRKRASFWCPCSVRAARVVPSPPPLDFEWLVCVCLAPWCENAVNALFAG